MKTNSKKRIIIYLTLFLAFAIFIYWFYHSQSIKNFHGFLKQYGIQFEGASEFQLEEVKNNKKENEVFVRATHGSETLKIHIYPKKGEEEAREYIAAQKVILENLYEIAPPPYPEFLDQKMACDEKFKPVMKNHKYGDYYLLTASERFGYGICVDNLIHYKTGLGLFYFKENKVILKIEYFLPNNENFEKIDEFMQSIKYNKKRIVETKSGKSENKKAKIEIFTVSGCPFTRDLVHALVEFTKQADPSLLSDLDIKIAFYGKELQDGIFDSFHGKEEAKLNITELCIIDKYPDIFEHTKILDCMNQKVDLSNADASISKLEKEWDSCTFNIGKNKNNEVRKCAVSDEGIELYRKSIQAVAADKDVKFPPTLKLNGRIFPATNPKAFELELCRIINSPICPKPPPECHNDINCSVREGKSSFCLANICSYEPKIKAIVLKDDSITAPSYFSDYALRWYQLVIGSLDIEYVDINSERGENLAAQISLNRFPAILISDKVERTSVFRDGFGHIRYIFSRKSGSWYVVDHERFSVSNSVIKEGMESSLGISIREKLNVSREMENIFIK